jgi:hypothetical protein
MNAAQRIVTFQGTVRCHRAPGAPGLTLTGLADGGQEASVGFSASAPVDLPAALEDGAVERIEAGRYRIKTAAGEWIMPACALHVHREVAADFYRVVRPRIPPWRKRLLWRVILALAASPLGLKLLRRLRG